MTNNLTATDARERWGDPNRFEDGNEVERACPWCASWLRNDGKGEGVFEKVVECKNLMCPLLPTGGCYWEPWPDGWTDENKKELKMNDRRGGGAGESPMTADTDKFVKQLKDAGAKVTIDGENLSAASMLASATKSQKDLKVTINGEEVKGIESVEIQEGSINDVVKAFMDPSDEPVEIRVKGMTARGMMGACFASLLENPVDHRDTWTKWDRFKQMIGIFFRPWKVWEIMDEIEEECQLRGQDMKRNSALEKDVEKISKQRDAAKKQVNDLIGDLERVSEQRDDIKRSARSAMLKPLQGRPFSQFD